MPPPSVLPADASLYEHDVRSVAGSGRGVLEVPSCPICDGTAAHRHYDIESFSECVTVCNECGLGRLHPMPDSETIRGYYPDAYYGEPGVKFQPLVEGLVRAVGARHVAFLTAGIPEGARVLDVGCGRGVLLGALADRGYEVHGLEISEEAARGADARASVRIAPSVAAADYPAAYFDQVIIWHVFEHLADPRSTLEAVHRALKPGGRLIVAVPNFSSLQARLTGAAWFHLDLPRHLYQFPLAGLKRLLGRTGFEVGATHHFSLRQNPFGWIQSLLNKIAFIPRNGLYVLLHQHRPGAKKPYAARMRAWLWLCLVIGIPLGALLTLLDTALRSGATVHVVAEKSRSAESARP
jgi:2-polyprenyl-3-methyl-5-hydroxy-6-metoxy-1,4-benzoquinol methylase